LAKAYTASSRSKHCGLVSCAVRHLDEYRVTTESVTLGGAYDGWLSTREGPLFGTEPDARVWALSGEVVDPHAHPVLDVGAGTGRNALALARRGHPVDAVEMKSEVRRHHSCGGRPRIASGSVSWMATFRDNGRCSPRLSADHSCRGGPPTSAAPVSYAAYSNSPPIVCSRWPAGLQCLPRASGLHPDDAARELGQQCNTMIFTRGRTERRIVSVARRARR